MERILMGGIALFSVFTLISYILIVLNVPFLIIPIVIISIFFVSKPLIKEIKKIKIKFNLQTILIFLIFIFGILGQMAVIAPSGIKSNGNILFWSSHGHDGTWHIALMEEIKKGWPFENPIFAGEKLINYHFFSDILPAMVSKYLPISNFDLYFRIFPFFYSLFLGASVFFLTKKLTKSFSASVWATIFTYFAGSFGFIVTYIKNKTIGGESIFWATQPQSSSGNPPQIISNFLILSAIYFLILLNEINDKRKKTAIFAITAVIAGTLISFKVYAAVVLFAALFAAGIWQAIKDRKFTYLLLFFVSGIISAIVYLPNTSNSVSFLILEPWWYIRTMIVEPSRLNLLDWELRRQTYIYEHNWKRVIWLEGIGFLIFFFGNLGIRFIGLWEFIKTNVIIKTVIVTSLIMPLLFLQRGVASNTSQFLQYFVLLFGILAGIATAKLTNKFKVIIPIIIIFAIPTQLGLLREFYGSFKTPRNAFTKINSFEIETLNYIKDNLSDEITILTAPYNPDLNLKEEIPSIWDWFDTSYVSAISARRTYFDDYEQADIMGYKFKERLEIKKNIFENTDIYEVKTNLEKTNADIIYFPKILSPKVKLDEVGFVKIFENTFTEVWKAN